MNALVTALWRGAAAGAADTTMLNLVTYADMVARARPAGSTPEDTVAALEERVHARVPGSDDERRNRLSALGVTDPRKWSAGSWASDLIPHVAYGAVTGAVLDRLDR